MQSQQFESWDVNSARTEAWPTDLRKLDPRVIEGQKLLVRQPNIISTISIINFNRTLETHWKHLLLSFDSVEYA